MVTAVKILQWRRNVSAFAASIAVLHSRDIRAVSHLLQRRSSSASAILSIRIHTLSAGKAHGIPWRSWTQNQHERPAFCHQDQPLQRAWLAQSSISSARLCFWSQPLRMPHIFAPVLDDLQAPRCSDARGSKDVTDLWELRLLHP